MESNIFESLSSRSFDEAIRQLTEEGYGKRIVKTMLGFGTSDIGYRLGGTWAEHKASNFVADELRLAGLEDVRLEEIPVDSFDFRGASVTVLDDSKNIVRTMEGSQITGYRGTPEDGITAPIVFVGTGTKVEYDKVKISPDYFKDKLVLIEQVYDSEWAGSRSVSQSEHMNWKNYCCIQG